MLLADSFRCDIMPAMVKRVSPEELVRRLSEILASVRERGDSFIVERNGDPVARIVPIAEKPGASLREVLVAWRAAGAPEAEFADDLEKIGMADRPPDNPWAS